MSSDSDSDICDFTSSVSKQMAKSKSFRQSWLNHKKPDLTQIESECNDYFNSTNEESTDSILINDESPAHSPKQDDMELILTQPQDVNIPNRITTKLNQLSDELEMILDKRRKKKATRRTRIQPQRMKRNTRSNQKLAVQIVLSSDEETSPINPPQPNTTSNQSDREINPIVTVNILWKSIEKNTFKIPKYQPLTSIITYYSEKFNVNRKLLFFTLNDEPINLEENSYVSLRLNDQEVIEGGILPETYLDDSQENHSFVQDTDLKFKVQCNDRRIREINVKCNRIDKIEVILWQVMNSIKEPIEKIRLYFDGHLLQADSKLADLDLEEGDCFDLIIKE